VTTRFHVFRARQAFTLLELLVAIAIFSIVLAAINTVFYSGLRLRNRSAAMIDAGLPIQHVTDVIQRDLASFMIPGTPLAGQLTSGQATTGPTVGYTVNGGSGASSGSVPSSSAGGGSSGMGTSDMTEFFVSSGAVEDNLPWGDVQKVSYQLVASANRSQGKDLVRSVSRNLLPVSATDQSTNQFLLSGVTSITFTYFDGTQWQTTWDTTSADPITGLTNVMPQAVKVEIQLAPTENGAPRAPVQLVVPIFVQSQTNQPAQTTGGQP
jgi:prepilin-type N-terminal cleavage/methylation domain-containing protein